MIFAILPVKDPRNAKDRLSQFLSAGQREELARMLYRRTLRELCEASGIDQVVVATSDADVAGHARQSGVMVFDEVTQVSHRASADAACLRAMGLGATTAMLVPIDVPLVSSADFSGLARAAAPGLIVVPSTDGTGTNALLRTPPNVIESRFGPGSFRAHMDQAAAKGVFARELRLEGLMFDIDTPEDIAEFLGRAPESDLAEFLRNACVSK